MELIVKFIENIQYAEELYPDTRVVELLNQYAIVSIPSEYVEEFSNLPEVVYVERPKRFYFNLQEGRSVSCISGVQKVSDNTYVTEGVAGKELSGKGVYIGIVDSGERVIIMSS